VFSSVFNHLICSSEQTSFKYSEGSTPSGNAFKKSLYVTPLSKGLNTDFDTTVFFALAMITAYLD
jgi:hypothetical protein